jgi:chromosome segregation ATPase
MIFCFVLPLSVFQEHAARFASLQSLNESLQSVSAETARLRKEQAVADKQLTKSSSVLEKKRPGQVALRQEIAHLTKNLGNEKSKLDKATAEASAHSKTTRALEKELAGVQASLDELRAAMEAEDEKSKELQLAAAQLAEYNALKQQSAVESAELTSRIKAAQHEHRTSVESAESLRIVLANIDERIKMMHDTQAELTARKERNEDTVAQAREQLKTLKSDLAKLREAQEAIKSGSKETRRDFVMWLELSSEPELMVQWCCISFVVFFLFSGNARLPWRRSC